MNFSRTKIRASRLGFSLIEIMVATVLMGLMGALLMTSINSSVNAKDAVEDLSSRYQMARQAMARMSREISMAYLSKHMHPLEPTVITQFKGRRNELYFSAFGHVVRQKDAKQSDQQVIGFYLGTDKKGRQSLMRRVHPNLNLDVEKDGNAQVLCPDITKLEFEYFDSRYNKWQETWIADVPGAASESAGSLNAPENGKAQGENPLKPWRLPAFVKISMTAKMSDDTEMTWVSEAEIPMQDALDLN